MNKWIGTWDVEQSSIVGTFVMDMIVSEGDGVVDVRFESKQVVATVSDIVCSDERLTLITHLTKPIKGKADVELTLAGPDSFTGTGKIKFLPASKFAGVRRS
ncbi:hypothetical protein [Agreia sp.]|uniref:hypothetical protein n=1 Tax=Agreia sp. TaxID=1872416 RepID=UPI0035BC8AB6